MRRQRAPAPPLAPHPGRPQKQHPPRQQAEGFRDHASPAVAAYSAGCGLPAIFGHRVQRPRCRLTWEQRAPDSSHLASLGPPAAGTLFFLFFPLFMFFISPYSMHMPTQKYGLICAISPVSYTLRAYACLLKFLDYLHHISCHILRLYTILISLCY